MIEYGIGIDGLCGSIDIGRIELCDVRQEWDTSWSEKDMDVCGGTIVIMMYIVMLYIFGIEILFL